jgi:hypothetical protein
VAKWFTVGGMLLTAFLIFCVAMGADIHRWELYTWLGTLFAWQGAMLMRNLDE